MSEGVLIIGYRTRNGDPSEILDTQVNRMRCGGWQRVEKAFLGVNRRKINVHYTRSTESNPRLLDVLDQKAREYLEG